jgi:8-oxo-dGTP diphosphatase
MAKILKISGQEIDQALRDATRQYLVGDLHKPQSLQHVPSSLIEIGITRYENEGKLEPPHWHKQAFEFQYMTAGLTAYLDLTTTEEHVFRKGDFYAIEPGAVYAQKSAPGTEILFIKVPPGNDKVPVDITPEVEAWFREPIKE